MRSQRGFTLMEIVIAIGITAMMGGVVAVSFSTSVNAKDVVEKDADRYRMIRAASNRMTREIGSAFVSARYDHNRYRDEMDRPTNFIGEREKLIFTSMAHQRLYADAKESDQMTVEYSVKTSTEKGARGRLDLIRRENPLVQDRIDRGGVEETLFEGIKKIQFDYWDSEKKEWDDEWDTRRRERKSVLPTRVRITLIANDENGKETKYTTQTRIMLNTEIPS